MLTIAAHCPWRLAAEASNLSDHLKGEPSLQKARQPVTWSELRTLAVQLRLRRAGEIDLR